MPMKRIVRQVLRQAGEQPHFFDLSDGERLVVLIEMGYRLGRKASRARGHTSRKRR